MTVGWRLLTPAGRPGALGAVALEADSAAELDGALAKLGLKAPIGAAPLGDLLGADEGIVCRPAPTMAILTAHGGVAILRELIARLQVAGVSAAAGPGAWPEAQGDVEAHMLEALARAPSPLAIPLLLDQPRRWREHPGDPVDDDVAAQLRRLLEAPTVAIIGPPNIGKSALLNALARRAVSTVADEPGTTRDHVGALIDCAGLVVGMLDAPGERSGAGRIEAEAQALARQAIERADLRLECVDGASGQRGYRGAAGDLLVGTRCDLGRCDLGRGGSAAGIETSAVTGEGVAALARAIRDALVPPAALADPRPWRFWGGGGPGEA